MPVKFEHINFQALKNAPAHTEGAGVSLRRLDRTIRLGLKSLWLHRLRSLLTMLGIVFGVRKVGQIAQAAPTGQVVQK